MTLRRTESGNRTLLEVDVEELKAEAKTLKQHEIQVWQFFFGQYPNGKDIEPIPTSWCGQISEGVKNLTRMMIFIVGTLFAFGLIDHRDAVIELFKLIGGK